MELFFFFYLNFITQFIIVFSYTFNVGSSNLKFYIDLLTFKKIDENFFFNFIYIPRLCNNIMHIMFERINIRHERENLQPNRRSPPPSKYANIFTAKEINYFNVNNIEIDFVSNKIFFPHNDVPYVSYGISRNSQCVLRYIDILFTQCAY